MKKMGAPHVPTLILAVVIFLLFLGLYHLAGGKKIAHR
jgi:hypothetical protein